MFNISDFIIYLVKKKKFILINSIFAFIIAVVYSFFIAQKLYVAKVTFLPPHQEKSILSFLPNNLISGLSASSDIMPQNIQTIFDSHDFKRSLIKKFDLYKSYKMEEEVNKFILALKVLKKNLMLEIDELGSLGVTTPISFSLSFYHPDPDTAYQLTRYAFTLLDSTVREISVSRGKQTRLYLEDQISKNELKLDSLEEAFNAFKIENKVYDVPLQIQSTLNTYSELKALQLSNKVKLKSLKADYSKNHPMVTALTNQNRSIYSELKRLEINKTPDVIPGLELSVGLLPTYTHFMFETEVQNKLLLLLRQQLEEAKLKESRDLSILKVIDSPYVPAYKAKPKRASLAIMVFVTLLFMLGSVLLMQYLYNAYLKKQSLFIEIVKNVKKW